MQRCMDFVLGMGITDESDICDKRGTGAKFGR